MKTKVYIGNCPNCGRECMSGLKTTSCWNCETEFTIPTDMQEISYVNSTSIESKGCDNEKEPCEDAISRQAVQDYVAKYLSQYLYNDVREAVEVIDEYIGELPPVTPQYTDAEIQKMQELEQAEIKNAYELGKADVLDKIRAEIATKYGHCDICEYFENYDYEENDISEYRPIGNIADILQIIDKYKVERSGE